MADTTKTRECVSLLIYGGFYDISDVLAICAKFVGIKDRLLCSKRLSGLKGEIDV